MKLHNSFRSSASIRLRVALKLKGLGYEYVPYALREGDARAPDYLKRNPQGLVPTVELEDGTLLVQSLAVIEWLEEMYPSPALLPAEPLARARVRGLAYMIACEIHPLNNLRVLLRLDEQFGANAAARKEWFSHWAGIGFDAFETSLAGSSETGRYCHGEAPGLADICLYAQVWNNRRFDIDIAAWPTIARIFDALEMLPAFREAAPPNQPDAA